MAVHDEFDIYRDIMALHKLERDIESISRLIFARYGIRKSPHYVNKILFMPKRRVIEWQQYIEEEYSS